MNPTITPLKTLEEIERTGIPGFVEVLREESLDAARYVLWDATSRQRDTAPAWRSRATDEQKRVGRNMQRIFSILCMFLREAHERQVEVTVGKVYPTDRRAATRTIWTR